MIFFHKHFL